MSSCIPREYIDTILTNLRDEIEAIESYKKMYKMNPRDDIEHILKDEMEHRDMLLHLLIEVLDLNKKNNCDNTTFYEPVRFQ